MSERWEMLLSPGTVTAPCSDPDGAKWVGVVVMTKDASRGSGVLSTGSAVLCLGECRQGACQSALVI